MLNTPPILPKGKKNHAKENSFPARRKIPQRRCQYIPSSQCGRVRTENVLLHLPKYSTTLFPSCQVVFQKNSKKFSRPLPYDKTYDNAKNPWLLLAILACFCHFFTIMYRFARIFRQKIVQFELFTFPTESCIITMLSAAPTPQHHAQRRIVFAKPQSYEVNAHAFHDCAFFNRFGGSLWAPPSGSLFSLLFF